MTPQDKRRFAIALGTMAEMFNVTLSDLLTLSYFELLKRFEIEEVERGVMRAAAGAQFFPKPVDIINAIEGPQSEKGLLAWTRAERARDLHGQYVSLDLQDPTLHRVIEHVGGWAAFCDWGRMGERDYGWKRQEFLKLYDLFAKHTAEPAPQYLMGATERQNRLTGAIHAVPPAPVLMLGPGPGVPTVGDKPALPEAAGESASEAERPISADIAGAIERLREKAHAKQHGGQ